MPRPAPNIRDVSGLDGALRDQADSLARMAQEDVVIDGFRRLMLRSPNGHYHAITVGDDGGLSSVDLGASPL